MGPYWPCSHPHGSWNIIINRFRLATQCGIESLFPPHWLPKGTSDNKWCRSAGRKVPLILSVRSLTYSCIVIYYKWIEFDSMVPGFLQSNHSFLVFVMLETVKVLWHTGRSLIGQTNCRGLHLDPSRTKNKRNGNR